MPGHRSLVLQVWIVSYLLGRKRGVHMRESEGHSVRHGAPLGSTHQWQPMGKVHKHRSKAGRAHHLQLRGTPLNMSKGHVRLVMPLETEEPLVSSSTVLQVAGEAGRARMEVRGVFAGMRSHRLRPQAPILQPSLCVSTRYPPTHTPVVQEAELVGDLAHADVGV